MVAFVRQLGSEAGVQLNPLADNSALASQSNSDQYFGIMMRLNRGRIDKPFLVSRSNINAKIGAGETVRQSALNESYVHVVEALNNGAMGAVVQRLTTPSAVISYAVATVGTGAVLTPVITAGVITAVTVTNAGANYQDGTRNVVITSVTGAGAIATATITGGVIASVAVASGGTGYVTATASINDAISFTTSTTVPTGNFLFYLKHLGCHNNGIHLSVHTDEKRVSGVAVANDVVTLELKDSNNVVLNKFTGSLLSTAKDDFGGSYYLPDIILQSTDEVELVVSATNTTISVNSDAYGYDVNGIVKYSNSGLLQCFSEGGTGYATSDYLAARNKLEATQLGFEYISSGGNKSVALLSQLVTLANNTNKQLRLDIDGSLAVSAAITFVEQLNLAGTANPHLVHAYWFPVKTNDPTGLNGAGYFGVATLNIAYSCKRNAVFNAFGLSAKNYPIAGLNYPINRTGLNQTYTPTHSELSRLADARINPCIYSVFSSGGLYVFKDSLTSAPVKNSLKKLISVAEMSTHLDSDVTRYANDALQLPLTVAIKRISDFLTNKFDAAFSSGWIVISNDPSMNGQSYRFEVIHNPISPYDSIIINYWLRYDGTLRQVFVTQTLNK